MPPQRRHRAPTSVSLITLYPFLFMTLSAAAQDNPTTTPPTVQPEVMIVPAQTPTSDLSQQHAAELEAQLIQRTQELDALQEQLRTAMEQLTSFWQQQHVLEALSGQLQTLEQRLTMLERDLVLAQEAEATARGLVAERDITVAQLDEQLVTLNKAKNELEQQLADAVQARDANAQNVAVRDQRIAALEHDIAEARQAVGQARQVMDQLARQVQELTAARADLERQLAELRQVRAQDIVEKERTLDQRAAEFASHPLGSTERAPDKLVAIPALTPPSKGAEPPVEEPPVARFTVHVASVRDPTKVPDEWRRLLRRHQALAGLKLQVPKAVDVPSKGTFYRVIGGAFATRAEAQAVCNQLRADGQSCNVLML